MLGGNQRADTLVAFSRQLGQHWVVDGKLRLGEWEENGTLPLTLQADAVTILPAWTVPATTLDEVDALFQAPENLLRQTCRRIVPDSLMYCSVSPSSLDWPFPTVTVRYHNRDTVTVPVVVGDS